MTTRRIHTNATESVKNTINNYYSNIIDEVEQNIESNKVVVIGMAYNPFCSKVCKELTNAGVEFKYLEYGSYFSMWKERMAIKLFTQWPTYPQVFVNGQLIGGFDDTVKELKGDLFNGLKKN